jgi:hypothetical protein
MQSIAKRKGGEKHSLTIFNLENAHIDLEAQFIVLSHWGRLAFQKNAEVYIHSP